MDKIIQKQIDSWLKDCPVAVITNVESRTPLEFIAHSTHLYQDGTHIFTSLDDLKKMLEGVVDIE